MPVPDGQGHRPTSLGAPMKRSCGYRLWDRSFPGMSRSSSDRRWPAPESLPPSDAPWPDESNACRAHSERSILGVAPPGFRGTIVFLSADLFVPVVNKEQGEGWSALNVRGKRWIHLAMGHLRAGVTPAQAIADLNSIGSYLETTYPKDDSHMTFSLARPGLLGDVLGRPARAFMTGLMLLAGLILLAACANLGGLFAARAADRSRAVALRLALRSTRIRILREGFTGGGVIY